MGENFYIVSGFLQLKLFKPKYKEAKEFIGSWDCCHIYLRHLNRINHIMSKKRRRELLKKGFRIQNEVTNRTLPQTINQIILLGSSFIMVLATLSDPQPYNICLYRTLLCFLLLSILSGVICISLLTIDYYILGKKIQNKAKGKKNLDKGQDEFHTGKIYYVLILSTFITCLLSFFVSVILLVIYAW